MVIPVKNKLYTLKSLNTLGNFLLARKRAFTSASPSAAYLSSSTSQSTMTRCVWILRHGERVDNVDPEWPNRAPRGAWDDPPITSRGLKQAREAGIALANEAEPIQHIFSSPFLRCLQTVNAVYEVLKQSKGKDQPPKVFLEPGFCESLNMCLSPPGCLPLEESAKLFPCIDPNYKPFLPLDKMATETTGLDCVYRIGRTLEHIVEKYPGNILIVSHGAPITSCHYAFTHEMAYVGQCSISKYQTTIEGGGNTKIHTETVVANGTDAPDDVPQKKFDDQTLNHERTVEGDRKLDPKTDKVQALDPTPICQAKVQSKPVMIKDQTYKCLYVGNTDHLSEKENLREVIHLTEADQAIVDRLLGSIK